MSCHQPSSRLTTLLCAVGVTLVFTQTTTAPAQDPPPSSYAPVRISEPFDAVVDRMAAAKASVMKRQMDLLKERYDLDNRPARGVTMSGGKPIQAGTRAAARRRLFLGTTCPIKARRNA